MTHAPTRRTSRRRCDQFTHPGRPGVEGRERGGARREAEAEDAPAPPRRRRPCSVLNGNGVAGLGRERALPARAARLRDGAAARKRCAERADAGLLPHADLLRQAADGREGGGERALEALRAGRRRGRCRRTRSCGRSTRARCCSSSSGETFHNQIVAPRRRAAGAEAPAAERPLRRRARASSCSSRSCTGCRSSSRCRRCSSARRIPDTLLRRQAVAALLDRRSTTTRRSGSSSGPAPASTGGSRRPTCRTRRSSPTAASSATLKGRDVLALLHGLAPAHGRAARPRPRATGS